MSVLKSCSKRALALLLATSLVLSGTPTSALAQAVDAADASAAKKSASTEGAAETAASSKAAATTSTAVAPAEGSDKDAAESSGGKADADVAKTEAAMAATAPNGSSSDEVGAGRSDAAADTAVTDATTKPAGEATATAESAASATTAAATLSIPVRVVGTDDFGNDQAWASQSVTAQAGETAADVTEQLLKAAKLTHESSETAYGYYLETITSLDGRKLGYDATSGKYWQLFVNGKASEVGASSVTLKAGDEVTWYYSAWGASEQDAGKAKVSVSTSVIGADAKGAASSWTARRELSLPLGSTVADLTERLLDQVGLAHEASDSAYGYFLQTITSPDGRKLGYDAATGKYWQLFVNGVPSQLGASSVKLEPGMSVTWYYSTWEDSSLPGSTADPGSAPGEPAVNKVEVDADAPRPDVSQDGDWAGYDGSASEVAGQEAAGGIVTDAKTATLGGKLGWEQRPDGSTGPVKLGTELNVGIYASDPIVVGGNLYVAVGSKLKVYDARTGEQRAEATLETSIDSVSRMVYADGLIVVPLHGGRLQAITAWQSGSASGLKTVWLTGALTAGEQSLSSLLVADGSVYFGTTTRTGTMGSFASVSLRTGDVRWIRGGDAGYYWSGSVRVSGTNALVVATDDGTVRALDASDGTKVLAELSLGKNVRSQVVTAGGYLYVVTTDGVLHKLAYDADAHALSEVAHVTFADYSTSTPTVVGGRAYVGGAKGEAGVLAVVDLAGMTVEHSVTSFSNGVSLPGEVKSTPTVSVQQGGTYVYFTCNAEDNGGAFLYRLGDDHASYLYRTQGDEAEFSLASLVPATSADGTTALYFVNDAGLLFRVVAGGAVADPAPVTPEPTPEPEPKPTPVPTPEANPEPNPTPGAGSETSLVTDDGNDTAGSHSLRLASNSSGSDDEQVEGAEQPTTGDDASDDKSVDDAASSASGAVALSAAADSAAQVESGMPAWPIVGIVIGVAALAWAVVTLVRRGGRGSTGR